MIKELILKNRSYRRFYENEQIDLDTLKELVDLARNSASAGNMQPLKYVISNTKEKNKDIFDTLGWAGYYKDWNGPSEGERPSAYIVVVKDTSISNGGIHDEGIAAQSILLGAVEKGVGGCMLSNVKKKDLKEKLNLDEKYEVELVVAIGKPKEKVILEEVNESGSIKYWRDENQGQHVPKRSLDEIIL